MVLGSRREHKCTFVFFPVPMTKSPKRGLFRQKNARGFGEEVALLARGWMPFAGLLRGQLRVKDLT